MRRALLASILALAVALLGVPPAQGLDGPTLFADPPAVAAQPTDWGDSIHDLGIQGDRLYVGFGDYGENTGPLPYTWVNLWTGASSSDYLFPGEQLDTFRSIGGVLHAPNIDPRGGNQPGGFGTSAGYRPGPMMAHTYDIVRFNGALFICGSDEEISPTPGAVVYRSTDNGATWTKVLRQVDSPYTGMERFYYFGVAGGRLFVQAMHKGYTGGVQIITDPADFMFPLMATSDGVRWQKVGNRASLEIVTTASDVESFAGRMWSTRGKVSDGKRAVSNGRPNVRDFFQAEGKLWSIDAAGRVAYTTGSTSWTYLPGVAVPAGVQATALAVTPTHVLAGTDSGVIYRSTR